MESMHGLKLLEHSARAGLWRLSADGSELWWSEGIYRILGLDPVHYVPDIETALAFYPERERVRIAAAIEATLRGEGNIDLELELVRADGRLIYVSVLAEPVIHDGIITHVSGAFFDIDNRRRESNQAAARLAVHEAELQEAQRLACIGSWRWSLSDGCIHWSRGTYEIFGIDPTAPLPDYEGQRSLYTPASFAVLDTAVRAALETRAPYELLLEAIHSSGERRWVSARGEAIVDATGTVSGLRGTVQDVTERRALERSVRDREQRFAAIFNSMFQFIGLLSPEGVLLEVNDAAVSFAGVPRSELVGKPLWECHWFQISAAAQQELQLAVARVRGGSFTRYEVEVRCHSGQTAIVDFSMNPVFDDAGAVTAIIPEGRDVTEARNFREQLAQSEAQFRSALQHAPIGMALVSLEGRFLQVNAALCAIVDYPPAELMQLTFMQITVPEDLDADMENLQRLIAGEIASYKMEKRYYRKDGSVVWVQLTVSALRDAAGKLLHFIAQIEDIHERKQSEAQLENLRQRHALALRSGDLGVWEFTPDTDTLIWDWQMHELYGRDALLPVTLGDWQASVHPEDLDQANAAVARCLDHKTEVLCSFRIRHPQRGVRYIEGSADVILDAKGTVLRVVGVNRDVTDAHLAQTRLMQSEERFRLMVDAAVDYAIILLDTRGHVASWNRGAERMYGYTAAQILGRSPTCLLTAADQQLDIYGNSFREAEASGRFESEGWQLRRSGERIWVNMLVTVLRDAGGAVLGYAQMSHDLTARRAAEQQLAAANHMRGVILEASPFAIITTTVDGIIQSFNAAAERMLGYQRDELVQRHTPSLLHDAAEVAQRAAELSRECGRSIQPGFQVFVCKAAAGELEEREWTYLRKDGSRLQVSLTVTALRDQTNAITGYLGAAYDITDRRRREALTQHIAQHDHLTGLPNRLLLNDRLEQTIRSASRNAEIFAVLMIDLDHFKRVNDSLGHHIGDELLKVVSQRLEACVRESDTVARMGGDEFVVLLPSVSDRGGVIRVAEAIVKSISQTIVIDSHELDVTPSVGVAMFPHDGNNANVLLKNADAAMYKAKSVGRACYELFNSELETKAINDLQIENELRLALRRGELELHYQPQICLATGQMIGVEALLRWRHPVKGMISPAVFIPIAESTGLILPISEWIIRTACRECLEIEQRTGAALMLAINLSPRQLENGRLCGLLRETLRETGFQPQNLELEITEGVLMAHIEDAKTLLADIQSLGVKIAIDDFGTGFSSLSYLTQLPINTLKIDRGFVHKVTHSVRDAAVVNAILALAQSLELRVIAEGVETIDQLRYLLQRQCHAAQGTLLGATLPADRFCVQGFLVSKALPAKELASRFHFLESSSRCSVTSASAALAVTAS